MLKQDDVILLVIDVQGNLARQMYGRVELFAILQKMIKGSQVLGIPIIQIEQNPKGLGPTIPEIAELISQAPKICKQSFSCYGDKKFVETLKGFRKKQVLITGIEAHVCIYQTAMDLLAAEYEVQVVSDAVSSRKLANKSLALQKMRDAGVKLTSLEMALFELLKTTEKENFRQIIDIVR